MGLQRNKVITKITEKARASYLGSAWYGFFQINLLYLDGQMGSPRGGAEEVGGSGSSYNSLEKSVDFRSQSPECQSVQQEREGSPLPWALSITQAKAG